MPGNWSDLTVAELAAKTPNALAVGPFGSRMKADCYVEQGVPVVRGNNISDTKSFTGEFVFVSEEKAREMLSCNVYEGDLIFPHRGLIGQVGIVASGPDARYVLSTSLMKLTPDPTVVDPVFLFYYFRSSAGRHELLKNASQVGTPGIATPLASLRSARVRLPPLHDQRAIAQVLSALDEKIDSNRRMNQTLEAMAQALFKSWFGDFDPVRAKVDGRQPPGIDAETAALFPNSFSQFPEGDAPMGWKLAILPEVMEINPPRSLRPSEVAPYLDMQNMPTNGHRPTAWIQRPFGSGMKFRNGDTLLARITPCLENGKTAFVDFLNDGQIGWGSTEYIVLRPKPPLPVEYGYYLARTDDFRTHAIQNMTGSSGRQRVPASCFAQYLVTVPPASIAQRFGELVRPMMDMVRANAEQSATLATIRDNLLPKLLSGELRVQEAEKDLVY